MKTILPLYLGLCLLIEAQSAEQTNAPTTGGGLPAVVSKPAEPEPILLAPPLTAGEVTDPKLESEAPFVGGAGPAIVRSRKPLQMLNPAAPKEYGDGTQFLSRNPHTDEPEGVTLLSFRLFSKDPGKAKAPKPPKAKKSKPSK
jgi:hypothetical protein